MLLSTPSQPQKLQLDLDILVVACAKRPPVITNYLKNLPHKINFTPDYPVPDVREWPLDWINWLTPPAWRCFRGHQDVMKLMEHTEALIFEDDALPNVPDWFARVQDARELLSEFEIVSLHGRNISVPEREFFHHGVRFVVPSLFTRRQRKPKEPGSRHMVLHHVTARWCCGSLAYLIRKETAQRFIEAQYDGFPVDLILSDRFKFCVCTPSTPFDHPNIYPSLVGTVKE